MALDPYRVLGLPPGSSAADVKRAYRRLAKANHPDSAGAAALPRFLEIQRAYETLTAVTWRPGMRRPAPSAPTEPWRAEPTRARSTPGAKPPGADEAGARGADGTSGSASTRTAPGAGTSRRAPGGSAGAGTGPGSRAGNGSRTEAGTGSRTGTGSRPTGPKTEGTTGRRRTSKKATFGSTTYDEAKESTDTRWAGASWYGPSSGEYWRVNPREYADPRKHGPEYLAKAAARAAAAAERRARAEGTSAEPGLSDEGSLGDDDRSSETWTGTDPAGAGSGSGSRRRERPAAPSREWSSRAERERQAGASADRTGADGPGEAGRAWVPPRGDGAWRTRPDATGAAAVGGGGRGSADDWGLSLPTLNPGPGMRRLLRALIAWPPLGIAAAALIGEATGCAAFEATCAAPADLYPWVAQGGILLTLLALPGIARILAGGTVAVLVLAFPVAAVLSASGATYDRTYGPSALMALLAIAWAVGVGAVLMRRAITRSLP